MGIVLLIISFLLGMFSNHRARDLIIVAALVAVWCSWLIANLENNLELMGAKPRSDEINRNIYIGVFILAICVGFYFVGQLIRRYRNKAAKIN
jgi:predicted MFS family arabinose efflux permease